MIPMSLCREPEHVVFVGIEGLTTVISTSHPVTNFDAALHTIMLSNSEHHDIKVIPPTHRL